MPICFTNLSFMAKRFCNSFYGRKFYGFYYWLKGKQQDHDIRIEPIAVQTAIIQMIIAAVGGLVFGLVLKTLPMQRCRCSTHSLQHLACLQLTGPAESILRHGSFGYLSILFMSACLSIKICFNFSLIRSLCINGSLWLVSMGKG